MTLRSIYEELTKERDEYLRKGEKSSILTIPSILPQDGLLRHQLPQNFQSVGARGVNNLTAKLMLTLFHSTEPFMRLEISPADLEALEAEAAQAGQPGSVSKITEDLAAMEQQALSEFDTNGWRPAMAEGIRQMVVTGNCLIYDRPGSVTPSVYDLRRFVVERDAEGNLQRVVLKESLSRLSAIQHLRGKVSPARLDEMTSEGSYDRDSLCLYTGAMLNEDGDFAFYQEIGEIRINDEPLIFSPEELPLIPMRFQPVYQSSYGRGYVEEYEGDLVSLEALRRSLVEAAMAAAKVLFLVNETGMTKGSVLAEAPNCAIRAGREEDVGTMKVDKGADMGVARALVGDLQVSLANAFLLNSSVQRAGERVTAEEIRFVAQELEDALGGVYASLAQTVQRPIVLYLFKKMQRSGVIAKLPGYVNLVIATGLEQISRNHKFTKLAQSIGALQQFIGPERVPMLLKEDSIARDVFTSLNLNASDYLKSPEEIAAEEQKAQEQQAMQSLGPDVVKGISQQQAQQ